MELMPYRFICGHCNKHYVTLVERSKLQELLDRKQMVSEIFNKCDIHYSGIFTVGFCSDCISEIFDIQGKRYCCEEEADIDKLTEEILDMCVI